jgi:hypothetical protein
MNEKLEALAFYRHIQTALNTVGVDHLTIHISRDEQMEVNVVMAKKKAKK